MTAQLRERALEALQGGAFAEALVALDVAIAGGDATAETALVRAVALLQLGRIGDARDAAQAILRAHVGHEGALDLLDQLEAVGGDAAAPASPVEGAWQVGATLHDRWEVFGVAEGGMGRVWFVRDRAWDGMELAVKSLRVDASEPARLERARKMFRRESQVWLDLGGHPAIVSGFYTLEVDELLRFFMEYVPGRSLAQWLHADRRLGLADVLDQGIQLAAGLEYVHGRGMVHRDLKPANCLVMPDRTLRITDFGLGKTALDGDVRLDPEPGLSDSVRADLSVASAGTPVYMAPEQWRSLGSAGAPADVYAIGVTLFELACGEPPFGGERASWDRYRDRLPANVRALVGAEAPVPALVLRLLHEQVAPLSPRELGVRIPDELDALIARCLAKAPAARPTAAELRDGLVACHARHAGPYGRELPRTLAPSPIGENNRAVSYFVMGETARAAQILDAVLATDATALFPWLNRASLALAAGALEPTHAAEQLAHVVLNAHPGMDLDRDIQAFRRDVDTCHLAHGAPVIAIALDGDAVITASSTGQIGRWDAEGPRALGLIAEAAGVAVIRGGVAVAAGVRVVILDGAGGHREVGAPGFLTALAGTDASLVGGDADGGVTVWRLDDGGHHALRGAGGLVRAVAICPSTGAIAAASVEGGLTVWDPASGRRTFSDPTGCLSCHLNVAWGIAVAGGADGVIRIYDLATRTLRAALPGHERAVTGVGFAPDGALISASADGSLRSWDARLAAPRRTWRIHHGPIRALRIARGAIAVTAGDDQAVRRTALAPRLPEPRLVVRKDVPALERRRRTDERDAVIARIAAGALDALDDARALRRRTPDLARDAQLRAAEHAGAAAVGVPISIAGAFTRWSRRLPWPAHHLALHPSGGGLAVGGDLGEGSELQLWDAAGELRGELALPRITALTWTRDGRALAVATLDTRVHLLAAPTLAAVWQGAWAGRGGIRALACTPDGGLLGAGWSRSVMRSSLQTTGALRRWAGGATSSSEVDRWGDEIVALAATVDGAQVAGARESGRVAVWDAIAGKRAGKDLEHEGEVATLAWSRDRRRLVAASRGGAWTTWIGGVRAGGASHVGGLRAAALASNDRHVVTAGADGTTRYWDVATGAALGVLHGHSGPVRCDALPDRPEVVTAGEDRLLHLWSVEYDWVVGEAARDDALAALDGRPSRAWPAVDGISREERARDVWRDVAAAPRLAALLR